MNTLTIFAKKLIEIISVAIMSVMSVMVFANVVLRYAANSSITSSEEMSRFLFVWLTFLAAILAYQENQHICVDFLVNKLGSAWRKLCKIIVDLMILGCSIFMAYGSWLLTEIGMLELSPVTMIPMGYVYFSGVLGGCGIALVCTVKIISDFSVKE